jgi:hypothetical protein
MRVGEINPVLQLIRSLAEIRLLLDMEVAIPAHFDLIKSLVAKSIDLIPVIISFICIYSPYW